MAHFYTKYGHTPALQIKNYPDNRTKTTGLCIIAGADWGSGIFTDHPVKGTGISSFVGLSDEGLAVPGDSFIRPGDEELVRKLEQFNKTQDYGILR